MAGLTHAHPGTRGRELLTRMAIATAVLEAVLLLEMMLSEVPSQQLFKTRCCAAS